MTWGSDDAPIDSIFSKVDWKLHFALLPMYALVMAALVAICFIAYCGLIQFGFWGPLVGVVVVWFVAGLFYALVKKK